MNDAKRFPYLPLSREQAQDGEYTGPGDNPPGYAGDYYDTNSVGHFDPETGEWFPVADCANALAAEFVVQACNNHYAMVGALEQAFEALGSTSTGQVLAARRAVADAIKAARAN